MVVYSVSPDEAKEQLRSLLQLSTAEIVSLNTSEEKIRNPRYIKHPLRVYPAYANLTIAPYAAPSSNTAGRDATHE